MKLSLLKNNFQYLLIALSLFISVIFFFSNEFLNPYLANLFNDTAKTVNIINSINKIKIVNFIFIGYLVALYYFFNKYPNRLFLLIILPIFVTSLIFINFYIYQNRSIINLHLMTHWVFSYSDFGYIKRSFTGSVIDIFLNENLRLNLNIILFLSFIFLFLLIYQFLKFSIIFSRTNKYNLNPLIIFLFSPVIIFNFFYDLGRLDQINYLILFLILFHLYEKKYEFNFFYISFLNIIGVLIHEAYLLFQFPLIFAFTIYYSNKTKFLKIFDSKVLYSLIIMSIAALITIKYGYIENFDLNEIKNLYSTNSNFKLAESPINTFDPSRDPFIERIQIQNMPFNSFFYDSHFSTFNLFVSYFLILLPLISIIYFYWINIFKKSNHKNFEIVLIFISCFVVTIIASFLMSFIDHYRYISGTILMLFISSLILIKEQDLDLNYDSIIFRKNYLFISILYFVFLSTYIGSLKYISIVYSKIIYNLITKYIF